MQLSVLGPTLVDGRTPPGAKERALLARLVVAAGSPVPPDVLIEAAWPGDRRDGVVRSLHVRLAKLRALLEPGRPAGSPGTVLVREAAGYRLEVAPDAVDAHRFMVLAEVARRGPAEAIAACEEALELWRGEPFADIEAPDSATAVEARRLHAGRDRLRHLRAVALRETDRPEEAAQELEALVEEDPLREELVRDLMLAQYDAGRHVQALDAYRALAQRLAEIGLQPGPEVRELETLMLRHADELSRRRYTASRPPTNVGARVASVVGRDDDLAAVGAALDEHRIVTLVGPGGVGKTTLATEAARALLDRMPDGAWLVELAPLRAPAEVLPAVGTALGLRRVGTGADDGDLDAAAVLRERLRDARVLLVLDRAEHLVPELGAIARELAAWGPDVGVLVTSRRPLGVPGEAILPVAPLPVPAAGASTETIATTAGGRLFVDRVRAACPGWELRDVEAAAVGRICRRLDGLPLALELAAARVRALSAEAIAERLDAGLGVLGRGTLDASIEASHALLPPPEQELFRRLSVFAGTFRLEDAERVCGGDGLPEEDVLDLLVALTEHSMVQADAGSPRRYRLLEALRDHGRARLDPAAAEAAARRHATYFATLGATTAARIDRAGAEAVGDPLVPLQWDLDAAFRWAVARQDADIALQLAAGLGAFHHLIGTVTVGRELAEQALALPGGDPANRLGAMAWQIALLLCELRLDRAAAAIERAVAAARDLGDHSARDQLGVFAAQLELLRGDLDAAERVNAGLYERTLARGERYVAAYAEWNAGHIAASRGLAAEAARHFARACEHMVEVSDICALDNAAASLAAAEAAAGREEDAARTCERILAFAPERPLGERNTYLLHEAALAALRAGDGQRAATLAGAALTGARRDPVSIGPWHAPAARGDVALAAGDVARAREEYARALDLALGVRAEVGSSLPVEARLALTHLRLASVAGDPLSARDHERRALEHARASRAPGLIAAVEAAAPPPVTAAAGLR